MGRVLPLRRRQPIKSTPQLFDAAHACPARELTPQVRGVGRPGEQEPRFEQRLVGGAGTRQNRSVRGSEPEVDIW